MLANLMINFQAACGLAKKPKDLIEDIDAPDVNNELAAVEYIEDIYHYYKLTEVCVCAFGSLRFCFPW